jgi:hypothetical protein
LFSATARLPGKRMSHSCYNTYRHAGYLVSNSIRTHWIHKLYLNVGHTSSIWTLDTGSIRTLDTQGLSERWTHRIYPNTEHIGSIWTLDTQDLSERWTNRLYLNAGHTGSIWTLDTQTHVSTLRYRPIMAQSSSVRPQFKLFQSKTTKLRRAFILSLPTLRVQRTPLCLIISNPTFCTHTVFICFVWIWEQTAIISLYSINWLVFIIGTVSVYSAVRTEFKHNTS